MPFATVGGSEPSYLPVGSYLGSDGDSYFRILRGVVSSTNVEVAIFGHAYQNTNAGGVFYLGGHQYSTVIPLNANASSDGLRYFLNALPNAGGAVSYRLSVSHEWNLSRHVSFHLQTRHHARHESQQHCHHQLGRARAQLLPTNQIHLTFAGDTNRTYELQTSSNLLSWIFLTNVSSANGNVSFTNSSANNPQLFYRIRIP